MKYKEKSAHRLIALLFLAAALLGIAGCISSARTPISEAPPESITVPDADSSGVTLTVYYGTTENADMMEQLCADFEQETGVRILWEAADNGTTELKRKFAANEAPDLFSIAGQDLEAWSARLVDLSGEAWVDDLLPDALKEASVGGRVLAWPHTLEANGIVYNKALFREAGIDEVPTTLDELRAVCRKLKRAGIQSFGESWMQFGYLAHLLAAPFAYEDAKTVSAAIAGGEMSFADLPLMDNYFELLQLTLDYGLGTRSTEYNTFYQYADFAAGRMAMIKQGTWSERTLRALNPELELGLFALPLSREAEENHLLTSVTTFLCINSTSGHREEAAALIRWWHEHAQTYLVERNGTSLPFKSLQDSTSGALNQDMRRYIESGDIFIGFGYEYWPADFHEDSAAIIQSYIQGLFSKETTLQKLDELYRTEAG